MPDEGRQSAFYINKDGSIFDEEISVCFGVRPAMWIKYAEKWKLETICQKRSKK